MGYRADGDIELEAGAGALCYTGMDGSCHRIVEVERRADKGQGHGQ